MCKTIVVAKFIHENYVIRNIKGRDKILRLQISVKKNLLKVKPFMYQNLILSPRSTIQEMIVHFIIIIKL